MGEGSNLPPGFQFFPSDEELVVHFLRPKAAHLPCYPDIIPTIDLHHCDPWDLDGKALQGGNRHWYFFTRRSQNRATANGYWHAVSTDETVTSNHTPVGIKKTLRYYLGEAPEGIKTNWLMHEYHLPDAGLGSSSSSNGGSTSSSNSGRRKRGGQPTRTESNKWVVCRVHESAGGSQSSFHDDGSELSCLDEVFLSLDDLDDISLPN
ncbi:NAC domain-containing protein 104 [Musa acuminata AAA Group]|uniref:NAC domain-containing protein 104 n=1 Tax=Musa acuminata AAA Group TaxID=214697 RepID=UPI0031E05FA5